MIQKTYFNWSTGKDSALALYHLQNGQENSVGHLLTSVNSAHNRISMHGLRRELLEKQVAELGLPWTTVDLPAEPEMAVYETKMAQAVSELKRNGFTCAAFGDIFLEDLRRYREDKLAEMQISCVFPLWKRDTRELMTEFIALGFKAVVVCVNAAQLDSSFAGRELDQSFLNDLPAGVDPCGENGEFHTFCYAGPIFRNPVSFSIGEKVFREYRSPASNDGPCNEAQTGFWFCDLVPV